MKRILALLLVVSMVGAVSALARPPAQNVIFASPKAVGFPYVARPLAFAPASISNSTFQPIGLIPGAILFPVPVDMRSDTMSASSASVYPWTTHTGYRQLNRAWSERCGLSPALFSY